MCLTALTNQYFLLMRWHDHLRKNKAQRRFQLGSLPTRDYIARWTVPWGTRLEIREQQDFVADLSRIAEKIEELSMASAEHRTFMQTCRCLPSPSRLLPRNSQRQLGTGTESETFPATWRAWLNHVLSGARRAQSSYSSRPTHARVQTAEVKCRT